MQTIKPRARKLCSGCWWVYCRTQGIQTLRYDLDEAIKIHFDKANALQQGETYHDTQR